MNSTKKNFVFSISMLVLGIVLLVVSNLEIMPIGSLGSSLFGMGCGLTSAGLTSSIISYRTLKNPKKLEEAEINETDERNLLLREKTNSKVYSIFVYIECAMIFLASILGSKEIVFLLSFLVIAKLLTWYITCSNLAKKY